jgi:hypothetical protein
MSDDGLEEEYIKNEAAVLFSGGIDSLLTAVLLLERFDKIHLITFDKGYLEYGIHNNGPNVDRLKERFGRDRVHHEIVDIKPIVRRLSVGTFLQGRRSYNSEIRWCVGCRLSMNTGGLIYALEHGLVGFADGSNREQIPSPANLTGTAENYPSIVGRLTSFAMRYAVHFMTPTYEFGDRESRRSRLRELGLDIDFLSRDPQKSLKGLLTRQSLRRSQPICISGWLIHWRRNLFGTPIRQDEVPTLNYSIDRQDRIVRPMIREYFAKIGIEIDSLVEKRRRALKQREENPEPLSRGGCGRQS